MLLLILVVLGSAGVRVAFDWPEILAGTVPSEGCIGGWAGRCSHSV